ncbi:hypothetical protein [Mesorhizobium sp.]|uniref:hypothetical protein n=1 Tax=Mesorhizobium sp. TaxID=1871066 RepID=UPI0025DDD272|nr:hypothetical protein [Mesorhizobium sp.]
MNTVLPARERPVTPSRRDGEKSPAARPDNVSSAILASSVKVVSDDAKSASGSPVRADIGLGQGV